MKKVLYIEDNIDTAEVVKIIIMTLGHKVDIAHDGKEGIEKLKKGKYNLVIFDVMLPDISGLKLFEIARSSKNLEGTKYAFLTITHIPEKEKEKLRKQGVKDFIPKPFQRNDLIRRVKQILEDK